MKTKMRRGFIALGALGVIVTSGIFLSIEFRVRDLRRAFLESEQSRMKLAEHSSERPRWLWKRVLRQPEVASTLVESLYPFSHTVSDLLAGHDVAIVCFASEHDIVYATSKKRETLRSACTLLRKRTETAGEPSTTRGQSRAVSPAILQLADLLSFLEGERVLLTIGEHTLVVAVRHYSDVDEILSAERYIGSNPYVLVCKLARI